MKTTTSTFKQIMATGKTRDYLVKITMTLADNTVLNLTEEDIWSDTFSLETATSGTSSFDLGCAIISKCKFSLDNFDERFNQYDFFNATAVVELKLKGDSAYYRMGFFTVDEPVFAGALINLELLDNMWKFDVPLSEVNISFISTTTIYDIVSAICTYCGVSLATQNFHGKSFVISEAPEEDMNCREMLQYVAMIGCNFCVIDAQGYLNIRWYNTSVLPSDSDLDGGTFLTETTPYSDGDNADGGDFTDYTSGDNYDGGSFTDNQGVAYFTRNYSTNLGTDIITITGLKITIDKVDYTIGSDGYVLELDNPLVTASNVNAVLNLIWEVLEDFRLRIFTIESLSDIAVEVGDCCGIMDLKGNMVYSYVTNLTQTLTKTSVSLSAVSPTRTLTKRYSKTVQTAVEQARKQTDEIISDYDLAVQMMNALAVNAMGAYQDYEDLVSGGRVYYLSNMPITKTGGSCSFETGSTVFKISGDGFFVSTDGGTTWTNGYNPQTGQLVVNVLNAIGVSAEWIKTGTLDVGGSGTNAVIRVKDVNNNVIGTWTKNGIEITNSGGSVVFKVAPDGTVTVNGYAKSSDLSSYATNSSLAAGTTTISGGCITTGTLSADRIKSGQIKSDNYNTTGSIYPYLTLGTVLEMGSGNIRTPYFSAINISDSYGIPVGVYAQHIVIKENTVQPITGVDDGIDFDDYVSGLGNTGNTHLYSGQLRLQSYVDDSTRIDLRADGSYPYLRSYYNDSNYTSLQTSDLSRTVNGTITTVSWHTSDRRAKENIESLSVELSVEFIDRTETKSFKYKNIDGQHYGMIAQDVREILDDLGENDSVLEHSMNVPEDMAVIDDQRTIDYDEYIPHLINYVKDLRAELDTVKAELKALKEG